MDGGEAPFHPQAGEEIGSGLIGLGASIETGPLVSLVAKFKQQISGDRCVGGKEGADPVAGAGRREATEAGDRGAVGCD